VPVLPVARRRVGSVEVGLLAQPGVGHRAEVNLYERGELAFLLVGENHRRVRRQRTLLSEKLERLARLALPPVVEQREPGA
jgi:hypothetical protein